jgi:hypothetical protein
VHPPGAVSTTYSAALGQVLQDPRQVTLSGLHLWWVADEWACPLDKLKKDILDMMEPIHHSLNRVQETLDRGFQSAEAQAKGHFEQLVAKLDERTLELTRHSYKQTERNR